MKGQKDSILEWHEMGYGNKRYERGHKIMQPSLKGARRGYHIPRPGKIRGGTQGEPVNYNFRKTCPDTCWGCGIFIF